MNLDKMLAFHCAPTLAGLKPANLIAHERIQKHYTIEEYDVTRTALISSGIHMERIWACEQRELTLVYHKALLEAHLKSPEIWGYLLVQGYPMYEDFESIIAHLKKRVIESGGFPHEVGVFLGYPLVDVMGFIKNKGQNCKFCGYWKVYGDAEEARCLFESYSKVRDEMFKRVEEGHKITQIMQVA